MASLLVLHPGSLPSPLRTGAPGRPRASPSVPTSVEIATPVEDLPVRMATSLASPYDTSLEALSKPGGSCGVPSLSRGRGRLLPPFLPMPFSAGSMTGGGRRAPCHFLRRGVLDFNQRWYLRPGGGVATNLRHPVAGVVAPQPGHLQWSSRYRRGDCTKHEGVCVILAS